MALKIKETPILFGEDARRFEKRMNEKRSETPEARETSPSQLCRVYGDVEKRRTTFSLKRKLKQYEQ